jgi:hypothetical protein
MTHAEWLQLMRFPSEWMAWGMIPDELASIQLSRHEPGHEDASEHDRHGAFQWWLRREPSAEVLVKLARLSWLDPDLLMGRGVRRFISSQPNCDDTVQEALRSP